MVSSYNPFLNIDQLFHEVILNRRKELASICLCINCGTFLGLFLRLKLLDLLPQMGAWMCIIHRVSSLKPIYHSFSYKASLHIVREISKKEFPPLYEQNHSSSVALRHLNHLSSPSHSWEGRYLVFLYPYEGFYFYECILDPYKSG